MLASPTGSSLWLLLVHNKSDTSCKMDGWKHEQDHCWTFNGSRVLCGYITYRKQKLTCAWYKGMWWHKHRAKVQQKWQTHQQIFARNYIDLLLVLPLTYISLYMRSYWDQPTRHRLVARVTVLPNGHERWFNIGWKIREIKAQIFIWEKNNKHPRGEEWWQRKHKQ